MASQRGGTTSTVKTIQTNRPTYTTYQPPNNVYEVPSTTPALYQTMQPPSEEPKESGSPLMSAQVWKNPISIIYLFNSVTTQFSRSIPSSHIKIQTYCTPYGTTDRKPGTPTTTHRHTNSTPNSTSSTCLHNATNPRLPIQNLTTTINPHNCPGTSKLRVPITHNRSHSLPIPSLCPTKTSR